MPLDVSRIRAVCFDVDGTLSDTDDYYVARFSTLLRRGLPFIRDRERLARRLVMWMESPGNALLGLADSLGVDGSMIALIDWMYKHRKHSTHAFPAVPGVAPMLSALHGHYPLGVVSARDEVTTDAFLARSGFRPYFSVVITALSAKHTKPYPDPIELAALRFGVPPQACLVVGDTTVDIRCGKAAGAQTVGVLCGFGEEPELRRQGADMILPSTAALADVLLADKRGD